MNAEPEDEGRDGNYWEVYFSTNQPPPYCDEETEAKCLKDQDDEN